MGNLNCVKVLLSFKADIESRYYPESFHEGYTPLLMAAARGHVDVVRCLLENGADVNARANRDFTPLMMAITNNRVNVAIFLIEHGADVNIQGKDGKTALHYAVFRDSRLCQKFPCVCGVCFIENGADVNVRAAMNDSRSHTPLMLVTILVEHGANIDLQDKQGDTALHCAVCSNSLEVAHALLSHGASQLFSNQGLTPLLLASYECKNTMVEDLLTRPEFTKEQKIDAMELLGASLATKELRDADVAKAFEYMKRGMEERFQDPCHPLLKKAVERVQSHYDPKESQTLEELARMEGDFDAIVLESLYIKERILGSGNYQFLYLIRSLATHYERSRNFDICLRFRRHAREVNQCYNDSAGIFDIEHFIGMLYNMFVNEYALRQNLVLEVLQKTVFELGKELAAESLGTLKRKSFSNYLVDCIVGLNFTNRWQW